MADDRLVTAEQEPFAMLPEWVLFAPISDRAVRLYCVLRRFARDEREAWPKRTTLAGRMHCSVDTVDRAMAELVDLGAVEKRARYRQDGGRASNGYHVLWNRRAAEEAEAAADPRPGVAAEEPQLERETGTERDVATAAPPPSEPKPPRTRARTPRDDLFDTLVAAFGPASTKSRAAFYGRTVGELVGAHATPEQVRRAVGAMRARGWTDPTPEALVKHWDSLLAESRPANPAAERFWEQ